MSRMDAARYGFIKFLRPPDAEDDHRAPAKPAGKSAAATDKREGKVKAAAAAAEDVPVLSESKEFIAIEQEQDIPGLAREMVLRWFPRNPSGILSLVSGTDQFHTWKRDDFRSALQAGIVKVLSSVDLIIIDDGLNYGLTKLMGSAVKADETYNTFLHKAVHAGPRKPPTYYVGVLPLERVAAREKFRTLRPNVENEVELVPQKAGLVTKDFDVNRHHSHYIVVDKSYADTGFLRVDLEKQLQNELGMRDAIAESNSDFSEKAATATFVPHIVLFFQGEFEEIDRIRAYVRLRTPVIIMDGCGGMADVLAFAVKNGLRGIIAARIARSFPAAADNKEIMVDSVEKILEIVRSGENPGENNLCYIVDCSRPDAFGALDVPFLQAVITASSEQSTSSLKSVFLA